MHIIESTNLREEAGKGLIVVLAEVDGARPVVAPLDHGARSQPIRSIYIYIERKIYIKYIILNMNQLFILAASRRCFCPFDWWSVASSWRLIGIAGDGIARISSARSLASDTPHRATDPLWPGRFSRSRLYISTNEDIDPYRPPGQSMRQPICMTGSSSSH